MSSIVFILGAGASRQCGGPLMSDFLDRASDLLRSGDISESIAQEQFLQVFRVLGELQLVHSKAQLDLTNIESVFTALELGRVIQRIPGLERKEIDTSISSLKTLIVKTLESSIRFPLRGRDIVAPKPYDDFAELLAYLSNEAFPAHSTSVITFNYDIALDMALFRENLGPDYIVGRSGNFQNPVPLMKLHGSLNWATESETKKILPLHLNKYLQNYRISLGTDAKAVRVPVGSQLVEHFKRNEKTSVDQDPVIVPPSWNKADYHNTLSDIWAAAGKHLSEAEHIFVIGYSLPETDAFFRNLYALGSASKVALRTFSVFNPDASGDVDERFRRLLGSGAISRYKYEEKTFEEAIPTIKKYFPPRKR